MRGEHRATEARVDALLNELGVPPREDGVVEGVARFKKCERYDKGKQEPNRRTSAEAGEGEDHE